MAHWRLAALPRSLQPDELRHGASLQEIGALLRHRSPETTQIYANAGGPAVDRELLLAGLVVAAAGVTLFMAGLSRRTVNDPTVSARRWERLSWRTLWWPMVPVVVASSILIGWAIIEPAESDEHLPASAALLATVVVGMWVQAAVRAIHALAMRKPCLAGTVGLWRPRVVVSEDLRQHVDADAWEAIQAHEAAHVRHRDPLRIWLVQLLTDLQWPGPGARRRFDHWRHVLELARDEEARESGVDGADLAAAVLVAARLQTPTLTGASLIVFVAWYNFCRVHQALRVTPAMEAGITDHVWTVRELLSA